jgi:hypothetical protein
LWSIDAAGCTGRAAEYAVAAPANSQLVETVDGPLPGDALVRRTWPDGRFDERGNIPACRALNAATMASATPLFATGEWPDGRKIRADDIARILRRQRGPPANR